MHSLDRGRIGIGVATALVTALLAAIPASADPPQAGAGTTSHGFLAARGALRTIDHPDAATIPRTPDGQTGTATLGINDRGDILGGYEGRDRVVRHFVRDRKGRYTILADPPGTSGDGLSYEAVDINNRDEIVGFYNDEQGATTSGFLRTRKGTFIDVAVPGALVTGPFRINDRRQVVGIYSDAGGVVHGFLWKGGKFTTIDVPGATATLVLGIDNRGQTVGSYVDADGRYHGFLRGRHGDVTTLPEAPGADPAMGGTQPASINDRGQIVGLGYDSRGGSRAFLLEQGRFRLLDGAADATYTRALDINNRGRFVGDYGTRPPGPVGASARRFERGGLRPGVTGGRTWHP
jgi:probable HAF family extracellular repeat protein